MLYSDLYGKLIILTGRSDITHVDIGKCIGLEKGAITARAKRNANLKDDEIEKISKCFKVQIESLSISENSLLKKQNIKYKTELTNVSKKISKIQTKNKLKDDEMAEILEISEREYQRIKQAVLFPDRFTLEKIKQNFKVSIDWLLFD